MSLTTRDVSGDDLIGELLSLADWELFLWPIQGTMWQDSSQTTLVTGDAQPVGFWQDLSGNGRHLSQATSDKRLVYLENGLSTGIPCVATDGLIDAMSIANSTGLGEDGPLHGFIPLGFNGANSTVTRIFLGGSSSNDFQLRISRSSDTPANAVSIARGGTGIVAGAAANFAARSPQLIEFGASGDANGWRVREGSTAAVTTSASAPSEPITQLNSQAGGNFADSLSYGGILITNAVLSGATLTRIRAILGELTNLTVA